MQSREKLEEFKKLLQENIESSDQGAFLKTIAKFRDQFKDVLDPADFAELERLLASQKKTDRPVATHHEFILFLVVSAFIISVFGEKIITIPVLIVSFKEIRSEKHYS